MQSGVALKYENKLELTLQKTNLRKIYCELNRQNMKIKTDLLLESERHLTGHVQNTRVLSTEAYCGRIT